MALALRWLHVLAAITWIGGMVFIALVLVPVLRRWPDAALRARLVQETGLRFRTIGWIALGLLLVTGLGNLWMRPYLLGVPTFQVKVVLLATTVALSVVHDFFVGPRAGRPGADPRLRVRATWVARLNAVVALLIVLMGLALRG